MSKYICIIRSRETFGFVKRIESDSAIEIMTQLRQEPIQKRNFITLMLDHRYYPVDVDNARTNEWQVYDLLSEHEENELESIEAQVHDDIDQFFKKGQVLLKVSLQDVRTGLVLDNCHTETTDTFEALTQAQSYNAIGIHKEDVEVILEVDYGCTTIYSHGAVSSIPILRHLDELKKAERERGYPDVSQYITHAVNIYMSKNRVVPIAADIGSVPALDYRAYFAENELQKVIDDVSRDPELAAISKRLNAILVALQEK